jgi:cell volume regulation protein A
VFVLVVVFTLVQAPALAPLARRTGLASTERGKELEVEAAPLDELLADLVTVRIPLRSRLHGVEVWELRLPPTASVTFVVREGRGFVPDARTALRDGDDLLIITGRADREAVERRLRAIGRSGRLAGFFGDRGEE